MAGAATVAAVTAGTALLASPVEAASPFFTTSVEVGNPTGFLPGSTLINFDDTLPSGVTLTGGQVVSGTVSGVHAEPNPAAGGNYLTVGPSGSGNTAGPAILDFTGVGNLLNYYGIYWGSIDTYNTLEFLRDGVSIATFEGSEFIEPPVVGGSQGPNGSIYVNFKAISPEGWFNQVKLSSSQFAFESDNHAFQVVPTPAAVLPGLIGMGTAVFRKKKQDDGADVAVEPAEANA